MRRIAAQIETLGPARFVLLIGLVAGAIQGTPRLLLGGANAVGFKFVPFLVIGIAAVLWWTAALFLWWIAIRRRQSSRWAIAAQVTLGLVIGDMLANVLSLVQASIDTHGQFAIIISQHLPTFIGSNLSLAVLRAPLWFVGAALAVALGRHLNGGEHPFSAGPSANTDPAAAT